LPVFVPTRRRPPPIRGILDQSGFNRVVVDVVQLFPQLLIRVDVSIASATALPEVERSPPISDQFEDRRVE
jgi:hypothetical protein